MVWAVYWTSTCLVCGRDNPTGLQATVVARSGRSHLLVTPRAAHAGFPGMLHGGTLAALLDESMWYAAYTAGWATLTGSLEVRFLRPAPPEMPLLASGMVQEPPSGTAADAGGASGATTGRQARWVLATARLVDPEGRLVASGRGRFAPAARLQGLHGLIRSHPAGPELVARVESWGSR